MVGYPGISQINTEYLRTKVAQLTAERDEAREWARRLKAELELMEDLRNQWREAFYRARDERDELQEELNKTEEYLEKTIEWANQSDNDATYYMDTSARWHRKFREKSLALVECERKYKQATCSHRRAYEPKYIHTDYCPDCGKAYE